MDPQATPLQPAPWTLHVTAVLVEPVTVAVNCWVAPDVTVAIGGLTTTVIGAAIVAVAVAYFVVSACEVAVT